MKKKHLLVSILLMTLLLSCKKVYAFDVNNYRYKELCGTYEVAGFHGDGYIDPVGCFGSFAEAKNFMKNNGANDLAILRNVGGQNKIVDANMALLDLSVNPTQLTYFYENSELTGRKYTYMDTGSLYGGVDGGLLDTSYSNTYGVFTAKVRIGNFTGWISQEAYEIVPITWIKSYSHYTVTSEIIRHNYITKIQNDYQSSGGNTIGPKPDMLAEGVYYSYDGHYFYNTIEKLMRDYKNNTYENSVNKDNPYYNYYMYLSNHTRTAYSSINIDEYIRNNMGYNKDVYGHIASQNTSRLYGAGTFFYYAQEKYGVNALLSLSLSRNETANGRSWLAVNKNNGFGLNAVDSNPIGGANWYPTFGSSILGYASGWVTYGFAHPRDWRYFGPQFGDKWVGMNVKYASDTYWSEKMASYYYSMDKALGMQDYNYYQLGVLRQQANAYSGPSTSSRFIYQYPEAEDAVVIVGEVTNNNEKWYKVVSDLNIDSNFNEITSGSYNWNSYVYVKADYIKKINNGKNGYISPNDVTEYQNKHYEYNMLIENGDFKPKVGISTKNTSYYYDPTLTSQKSQTLLKDRYVIVFAIALENNIPVSYLVTSDYYYSQKEWVPADSIRLTDTPYGKVTVDTDDNRYTWVNYNTEDAAYSLIGGLYTYAYVPIIASEVVNGETWYKVPVSLSTNENVYGYTLARYSNIVWIDVSSPVPTTHPPIISASNKEIIEGDEFNPLEGVSAFDNEDGDLTSSITIKENNVNNMIPGTYSVIYEVTDSDNHLTSITIQVTVIENKAPVITTSDIEVTINSEFDELNGVEATDEEDGDLTSNIQIIETDLDIHTLGEYHVIYEVADSRGKKTTKERIITVVRDREPVINATDKTVAINALFNPLAGVSAIDPEDGDITNSIEVIENTVNTSVLGTYSVTYRVVDSCANEVTKTITVEVIDPTTLEDGEFYLHSLSFNNDTKKYEISGYLTILNQDNTNKVYELEIKNKDTNESYKIPINKWTESIPYELGVLDGHDYNESWFKDSISLSNLPNGDYDLYMTAYSGDYYTTQMVDNFGNRPITRRAEDNNHGYEFKVLLKLKSKQLELKVRDELYTTSEAPTFRNMINDYEEARFENDKLYLLGYSYNYNASYSSPDLITRKLILEKTDDYSQTVIDLGATTGPYSLLSRDNLDKTYAWYEKEIDLSELEPGTYSMLVYTKTTNAEDYGEMSDMFRILHEEATINNRHYTITYNRDRQNRLEITVE